MLTPHGPPSMECDATYPCSSLIQHAYLTNNYFKENEAESANNILLKVKQNILNMD